MNKKRKTPVVVKWSVATVKQTGLDVLTQPPTPFIQEFRTRFPNSEAAQCGSLIEYYKNAFVVTAPCDMTISLSRSENGLFVAIKEFQQSAFDETVLLREDGSISVPPKMIFTADEPVIMESLPLSIIKSQSTSNITWVSGEFDISKWVRPIDCTFYFTDEGQLVRIYRGDPLFILRFRTSDNQKVVLERVPYSENLKSAATACWRVKEWSAGLPLERLYSSASSYLKSLGMGAKQ